MTIPGLISKWSEKATVAQVKETYSILQQGLRRAIDEYGDVSSWCNVSSGYDECSQTMFNNLSATTRMSPCGVHKCFSSGQSYKNRFGKNNIAVAANSSYAIAVLNNGTTIAIKAGNGDGYVDWWCRSGLNTTNGAARYQGSCGRITVDLNGKSGPNTDGRDVFEFVIYDDGLAPKGVKQDVVWTESFKNQCMGQSWSGVGGCTGWVVINGNMDYLHTDNLDW